MQTKHTQTQKGIKIEATKSQLLSAVVLIIIMLFGPIFTYNYITQDQNYNQPKSVYTRQSTQQKLSENDTNKDKTGRVAGIYDSKKQKSNLDFLQFLFTSSTFFILLGIFMFVIFAILSTSLVYDLMHG